MIQCPWCTRHVILINNICPECKHEIKTEHLADNLLEEDIEVYQSGDLPELGIEELMANKFKCSKCIHNECLAKEVSMSGTGLSKIFDIDYNHYLFVTCMNCGFVEVYNPDVLRGHKSGKLGTIMDILFG
jgi:predicted nucleic-acid-binding Zn-ribbon protein